GGVYVGATRGREDNTIHIVADDLEDAKAQFITTRTRDRAERGLDQARADLAAQLPKDILEEPAAVPRYIDRMDTNRTNRNPLSPPHAAQPATPPSIPAG